MVMDGCSFGVAPRGEVGGARARPETFPVSGLRQIMETLGPFVNLFRDIAGDCL
jgi:hypothetical protein